jgi:hypothetical protein
MSIDINNLNKITIGEIFDALPKDDVQSTINTYLTNKGFLTKQQVDAENERIRLEKLKKLELEEKNTRKKIAITLIIVVGSITALWFITQKVKKNGK